MDWIKITARPDEKHLNFEIWCDLYKRFYGNPTKAMVASSIQYSERRSAMGAETFQWLLDGWNMYNIIHVMVN